MSDYKQLLLGDDLSFEVHTIEWLKTNRSWPEEATQRPLFQIVWITKGAGYYCIDMEKYPLAVNTLYFVPPGRMQYMQSLEELAGWVVSFKPEFLQLSPAGTWMHLYKEMVAGFSRVIVFRLSQDQVEGILTNIFKEIIRESGEQQSLRAEALGGLLHIFLIYLQRLARPLCHEPMANKKVDLFNDFYCRVDKDFLTKRQVSDYASEMAVTPNYLSDVVKRVSGHGASYHIQQRMVLEAKRLAMYSDASMKMIAYKLGFDDLSHFSKFFKNVAGVNFSEFRNRSTRMIGTTDEVIGQLLQATV